MQFNENEKNRGAHGDSSFMLGGMPLSSENPPASAVGSVKIDSGKYYIIRCDRAGVFFAHVAEWDPASGSAALTDCRRLWYWDGAASLSQLANEGVKRPGNCKFTVVVPEMVVGGVIELIPCSDAAVKSVTEVPEWRN